MASVPDYVVERIRRPPPLGCQVVLGSTPVICFGDPNVARAATIGSNPGRSAFLKANALVSDFFETLPSLGVSDLTNAPTGVATRIYERCLRYFALPHHRRWFGRQKAITEVFGASYADGSACHLDLVQWATYENWTQLPNGAQRELLKTDAEFLARQLEHTQSVEVLVLNGDAVLSDFIARLKPSGSWLREALEDNRVRVMFWSGRLEIGGRMLAVVGWNKNLQQTRRMTSRLRRQVLDKAGEIYGLPADRRSHLNAE